jgi:hypothetical protein
MDDWLKSKSCAACYFISSILFICRHDGEAHLAPRKLKTNGNLNYFEDREAMVRVLFRVLHVEILILYLQ